MSNIHEIIKHNEDLLKSVSTQGYIKCKVYAVSINNELFIIDSHIENNGTFVHTFISTSHFIVSPKIFDKSLNDYERYRLESNLFSMVIQKQLYNENIKIENKQLQILLTPILLKFK